MEKIRNVILAIFFLCVIGVIAIAKHAYAYFGELVLPEPTTAEVESSFSDELPTRSSLNLSGIILKTIGVRSFYNEEYGFNVTSSGYIVGQYAETTAEYEISQMVSFQEYLQEKGIGLLYVNEPAKYIDDTFYAEEFGAESYLNRNADLLLEGLAEAGIEYIDLRDNIREEGIDPLSLFYRTDHHWTVPAAEWAAGIIAERLNADYGYDIDLSLYDEDAFESVYFEDAWLGEQGRKLGPTYIGLDDYTMMKPTYETDYTVWDGDEVLTAGDFGIFIKTDVYNPTNDLYTSTTYHNSYDPYKDYRVQNNLVDSGNVLILGDSYEICMAPLLSVGLSNYTFLILRNLGNHSVREWIETGDYDTVIVAYAQFMIGAHDDPDNDNYRMFQLD